MGTSLGSIFIDLKINLKALDAANRKLKGFSKTVNYTMKNAGRSVVRMERTFRKSFNRISNDALRLGGILTAGISLPIKEAFKNLIGSAAFDELEFVKLRKLLPVTDERAQEIREGLREIIRRVPLSTAEISNVGAEAARLGVAERYIENFTEVMGKMSFATVLGSQQAAIAIARFSNIVNLPLDQVERLGSAIVHLGNNFAANEQEIAKMSLRLGALKQVAGATIPEILGLSAAFPAVGLFPELVGTSMTRIMIKLQQQIKKSKDTVLPLLASLTEQTEGDFLKSWKDSQVQTLLDVAEGMDKAKNSGVNFAEMLDVIGLDGHRITMVMAFMSGKVKLFRDAIEKANEAFYNSIYLQREFDRFMNTLTNQFFLLTNQLKLVGIQLGTQFFPIVRNVVKEFIEKFIPALEVIVKEIGALSDKSRILIMAFAFIAAVMGPLIFMVGILIKAFIILGTSIAIFMGGFLLVATALAFTIAYWNEIVAAVKRYDAAQREAGRSWAQISVILKTGAQIIYILFKLIYNHIKLLMKVLYEVGKVIVNVIKFIIGELISAVQNIARLITGIIKFVVEPIAWAVDKAKSLFKILRDHDEKYLEQRKQTIAKLTAAQEGAANKEMSLAKKLTKEKKKSLELSDLKAKFTEMFGLEGHDFEKFESYFSELLVKIEKRKEELSDTFQKASELEAFDPEGAKIKEYLDSDYLSKVRELMEGGAEESGTQAGRTFSETFLSTVESDLSGMFDRVFKGEFFSLADIFRTFVQALTSTWSKFLAEEIVGGMRESMKKTGISGFLDGLFGKAKGYDLTHLPGDAFGGMFGGGDNAWYQNQQGAFGGGGFGSGGIGSDGFFGSKNLDGLASGGVLVGENGPEMVMNAKATKNYGSHLAAINKGIGSMDSGSGTNLTINQDIRPGVTQAQLGAALAETKSQIRRELFREARTPDSAMRRTFGLSR